MKSFTLPWDILEAIDLPLVWSVIERDLPMLRRNLEALLSAADRGEQP